MKIRMFLFCWMMLLGCGNLSPGPTGSNIDPPGDGKGIRFSAQGAEIAWIIGSITGWTWSPYTSRVYTAYPGLKSSVWTLDASETPILTVEVNSVPLVHVDSDTNGTYFTFVPWDDGSVDQNVRNVDQLCAMNVQIWDDFGNQLTGEGFQHSVSWNNYRVQSVDRVIDGYMMPDAHAYCDIQQPPGWDIYVDPWWATVNGDTCRFVTEHRGPFNFYFYLNRDCRIENPGENWPMAIDIGD